MSLPPQTIRVKRKRNEEPVDTLYIEREGEASSEQSGRPIYRRVQPAKKPKTAASNAFPEVPTIKVLAAAESDPSQDVTQSKSVEDATRQIALTESALTPTKRKPASGQPRSTKRVFHLSATRSPGLRHTISASSLRSANRRKNGRHPSGAIAVFAEHRKAKLSQKLKAAIGSSTATAAAAAQPEHAAPRWSVPGHADNRGSTEPSDAVKSQTAISVHKRPAASSAEKKWREENWKSKPKIVEPVGQASAGAGADSDESLALAAELQQFALQATTQQGTSSPTTDPLQVSRKPLKYQPRAPPPRNRQLNASSESSELSAVSTVGVAAPPDATSKPAFDAGHDDTDDEVEWVYDTYVRESNPQGTTSHDASHDVTSEASKMDDKVGYLVIRTEDEEAWEEFMSDDDGSGDERWYEDDEDSNAEDYYANDYPDELDSDDEWVGGDFGGRNDEWSD